MRTQEFQRCRCYATRCNPPSSLHMPPPWTAHKLKKNYPLSFTSPLYVIHRSCLGSEQPHGSHALSHAPKILSSYQLQAQPRRNVQWSWLSVCLCVCLTDCPSPHSHTTARTGCKLEEWQGLPSSCALLGFVAMTTERRTRNVSECLYSLYAWLCFKSLPVGTHNNQQA